MGKVNMTLKTSYIPAVKVPWPTSQLLLVYSPIRFWLNVGYSQEELSPSFTEHIGFAPFDVVMVGDFKRGLDKSRENKAFHGYWQHPAGLHSQLTSWGAECSVLLSTVWSEVGGYTIPPSPSLSTHLRFNPLIIHQTFTCQERNFKDK